MLGLFLKAYRAEPRTKIISKLYNVLQDLEGNDVKYVKEKCEKEGGFTLPIEEWEDILKNIVKCTASINWREFVWKNVIRFFRVPSQGASLGRDTSCWRKCGNDRAGHFHIFWDCPKLSTFWQQFKINVEIILGIKLSNNFQTLYLGKRPAELKGCGKKYMYNILLVAAKKSITRRWLSETTPTVDDWVNIVNDIYKLEKLTYLMRLDLDTFEKYWKSWREFVAPFEFV